ncbi:MAG: anthranilate phosphoribosyltransferase [Acidimicrobiales bacterium]
MTSSWTGLLNTLAEGSDLSRAETSAAMAEVLNGEADPAALGALLMGLRVKGESDDEILGFADAMLAAAEPLTIPEGSVDIVGTGGSKHRKSHALNVSSMASFVAAAAGATVCKHGNVAASSSSGSFDFLDAVGVDINPTPTEVEQLIERYGLAFAWAKTFHPAMRHAGPVRAAVGIPTVFNILGPLVHPGHTKRIVLGVASDERAEQMARILSGRGMARAWVVAGHDGLDELSTVGPTRVWDVTGSGIKELTVHPEAVGIPLVEHSDLAGGDGGRNAEIFRRMITDPDSEPAASGIVRLNAGAALLVAGVEPDLVSAVAAATDSLTSGKVAELFETFTTGT